MISLQKRIWSLLNNGIELVVGIGLVAIITRVFTAAETGVWFLFIAVFGIAGSLRDALVQSALVKHTAGVRAEQSFGFLKANLMAIFGFELVSSLMIVVTGLYIKGDIGNLLTFYPLYALPNAWFRWQVFYLRSHLRMKEIFFLNMTNLVVLVIGCVAIYTFDWSLPVLIVVLGAASFLSSLIMASRLPYKNIVKAKIASESFSTIRQYGLFAMMREATSALSSRISLFYSSSLLTLQQTAFLGVSQRFSQITLLPNNAFQSILFPALMKTVNEGDISGAKKIFEQSIAQLLAMTIPFALTAAVLSPHILEFISGPSYRTAWGILTIYLLLSTLITPFGTAFGSLVTALGKPGVAFKVVLVNSLLNTLLGFFLMRSMGLVGGPLALAVTEVIGFVWIGIILRKMANVSFINTFLQIPQVYVSLFYKSIDTIRKFKLNTTTKSI